MIVDTRRRAVHTSLAVATSTTAAGCTGAESAAAVLLIVLKVLAGLVVAVLVFFPLMASIAAIRAAIRRYTGKSDRN
jgi:hypothetical protein